MGVGVGVGVGVGAGGEVSRLLEAVEGARARDLRTELVVLRQPAQLVGLDEADRLLARVLVDAVVEVAHPDGVVLRGELAPVR